MNSLKGGKPGCSPDVGIVWPAVDGPVQLSDKDRQHKGFAAQTYEYFEKW